MREKKISVWISIITMLISLALAALFKFRWHICGYDFISNAILGVFGSATATLFIFIYQYNVAKCKTITDYCSIANKIEYELSQLQFIHANTPSEFLESCCSSPREFYGIIKRICEQYYHACSYYDSLKAKFNEISFFSDSIIGDYFRKKRKNRKDTKLIDELINNNQVDVLYDSNANGKQYGRHKEIVFKRIQSPFTDFYYAVTEFITPKLNLYEEGQITAEDMIKTLMDFQKNIYQKKDDYTGYLDFPWKYSVKDFQNTLEGEKLFWKEEKEKGNKKTARSNVSSRGNKCGICQRKIHSSRPPSNHHLW